MGQPIIIWPPDCGNDTQFWDGAGNYDPNDSFSADCTAGVAEEYGPNDYTWVDCTEESSPDGTGLYCCGGLI